MINEAVIYVRVSTAMQTIGGDSLEVQMAQARAYCQANNLTIVGEFQDAGISGMKKNRPGLQDALNMVCEKKGVLVFWRMSRVSRSTVDMLNIAERLERAGAGLVSLNEKIDTTTAAGKMVFRMLAVIAEFERDMISENTKSTFELKKSKGEVCGGKTPYGFDEREGKLVENETEKNILNTVRELKDSGMTLREIAGELDARGLQSRSGRWHAKTISRILKRVA